VQSYVELHCHSCYSLREGASTPVELLNRAGELGYDALALTDHDGLYGAMEFARAAHERGIRPITGAELTLANGHHLTLLVESPRGYANLCRLISSSYGTPQGPGWEQALPASAHAERTPALSLDALAQHTEGLIALSGCPRGEVPALVQAGRYDEAAEAARRYVGWFGPRGFLLELQQNLVYGDTARNAALADLAESLGIDVVGTNNVHYHLRERSRLHDVLVAIRHRATLDTSHRLRRANAEFYLKAPAEMAALLRPYPAAVRASRAIAERCAGFDLVRDLRYGFPDYPTPSGLTPDRYLEQICREAMTRKYSPLEPQLYAEACERLQEELRLIALQGLAGFFLTYRDILALAGEVAHELRGRDPSLPPDERPVGRGRGSSVSSLVCYLIGLSHVDPVRNKLFLGRFLNEELASVPDIDIDLPRDIRAALIERMYQRYPDRVGLVCILPTYRLRSAVRDVGKALGLPAIELDTLAKLSERYSDAANLAEQMTRLPQFADRRAAPLWRDLVDLAEQLRGFPRHVSQHVGGMVLSMGPIAEVVPVEPAAMPGRFLIQWDKDSAADARFVKIDLLALGMLSLVDECLETIEERHGSRPDFSRIGYEETAVYDQICRADTIGVFQIESRAQIQTLPSTQPRNLDDLAVEVAIIRPGPIVGGAARPYMEYRRRQAAGEDLHIAYDHPLVEPALRETLGVILFQEQVLQVAMAVGGFRVGQAESLRRAMSRHRSREAMESHRAAFLEGAARNSVPPDAAETIFQKLLGFASFGFPRSHAVAFARLAYESAWLRLHFPVEYYCALFNNQPMGFYSPGVLIGDAKRHGIQVLRPDINRSDARCTVESDETMRLGLGGIRGLSVETAAGIVAERRNSPFRSLFDVIRRTGLPRACVENLILAGALDDFGLDRRELLWQLGLFAWLWEQEHKSAGEAQRRVAPLQQQPLPLSVEADMIPLRPMHDRQRLVADYAMLGFSPALHPFSLLRASLGEGIHASRHVERMQEGEHVRLAGMVVCRQRPSTAHGVTFLLLEDEFGLTNVIVQQGLYERQRPLLRMEPFLLVHGIVQRRGASVSVLARTVQRLNVPHDMIRPDSHDFH
jgi:error-prone DNA polymerase